MRKRLWLSRVAYGMLGAFLALQISPVMAQVNLGTAGLSAGGTVSGPILFPAGTAAAPSIAWADDADGSGTGWYRRTANSMDLSINGSESFRFNVNGIVIGGLGLIGWNSAAATSTGGVDAFFTRENTASVQMGADATTAAVDQTLSAADAITNADIAGGDLTIQSGAGMGTGTVSSLIFQTPTVAAAGANAQSLATRLTVNSTGTLATGTITSSATSDLGWARVNGANTACNTTCTNACVFGWDSGAPGALLACTDATADSCLCAGSS